MIEKTGRGHCHVSWSVTIDVLINVVNAVEITLEFAVPASCSVYALSDGAIDLLKDAWSGVLTVAVIGDLAGIDVDMLVELNVNILAGVTTEVKFAMPASLDRFSC